MRPFHSAQSGGLEMVAPHREESGKAPPIGRWPSTTDRQPDRATPGHEPGARPDRALQHLVGLVVILSALGGIAAGAVRGFPEAWVAGFEVSVSAVTLVGHGLRHSAHPRTPSRLPPSPNSMSCCVPCRVGRVTHDAGGGPEGGAPRRRRSATWRQIVPGIDPRQHEPPDQGQFTGI